MEEAEFLKEHPSLRKAIEDNRSDIPKTFPDGSLDDELWVYISEIHKTQIDKQIVAKDYIKIDPKITVTSFCSECKKRHGDCHCGKGEWVISQKDAHISRNMWVDQLNRAEKELADYKQKVKDVKKQFCKNHCEHRNDEHMNCIECCPFLDLGLG